MMESPSSLTSLPSVNLKKGFILGGASTGANFIDGISHILAQRKKQEHRSGNQTVPPNNRRPRLAGTIYHEDARAQKHSEKIPSVDEGNDTPGLTRDSIKYFASESLPPHLPLLKTGHRTIWNCLLPIYREMAKYEAPATDIRRSPLLFDSHAGLATRAVFYVCGWDPRRDETLLMEEVLRGEGVQTTKFIYPGLPHGLWTTCPNLNVSKEGFT